MKYRPEQYAQALLAACHEKSDVEQKKIVKRFVQLLVRHQATSKIHAICAAYEKLELRNKGMRNVRLETAGTVSEKLKNGIYEILGKHIQIKEMVNPNLLGGLKILIDDEILIDASARRQMEELFIKKPPSTR
ncbi:MAG: F0F1 ATP synthase subunit delta [Patescibacteria group bacterium]